MKNENQNVSETQSKFTVEEKRKYMWKKHLKNHWFEYLLDIVGPVITVMILLEICKAERRAIGIAVTLGFSVIRVISSLYHYKKEFVEVDQRR